jgi:hypothetical protein
MAPFRAHDIGMPYGTGHPETTHPIRNFEHARCEHSALPEPLSASPRSLPETAAASGQVDRLINELLTQLSPRLSRSQAGRRRLAWRLAAGAIRLEISRSSPTPTSAFAQPFPLAIIELCESAGPKWR